MAGELSRTQVARILAERQGRLRAGTFSAAELCGRIPQQRRAVESRARRKVLRCGRRAGKTTAVAIKLLLAALEGQANVPVLYVTLTRENAREIIWADLLELNQRFALGGRDSLSRLTLTMPNGCEIQLRGAHTAKEINKYRGKKFKLVIVDEAQAFPDRILDPLIKEVIGPTLVDYQGELWLVGTPPPLKRGYFWRCYAGDLAPHREQHQWTIVDNLELPARKAGIPIEDILADVRQENGWDEDDPTYQREYLGADIEDLDALLFQYRADRNVIQMQPTGGAWNYVFGIDIGAVDSDAVMVWGWRAGEQKLYLVAEEVADDQDVTDLAQVIKRLMPVYRPVSMVIDEGGGGKKTAMELRRRHGIPVKAAEKTQKGAYIRMFNADLRKGVIQVVAGRAPVFVEDCGLVRKDPEGLARGLLQELPVGKGGYHSDACDGALYGWREAYHFLETKAPPPPPVDENAAHLQRLMQGQARAAAMDPIAGMLGFED